MITFEKLGKLIAIDGNNVWVEIPESEATDYLKISEPHGAALRDGDLLRSNTSGVTLGKYFRRYENAICLSLKEKDTKKAFEELESKDYSKAFLSRTLSDTLGHYTFKCILTDEDVEVNLDKDIEIYRDEIMRSLPGFYAAGYVDTSINNELLKEAEENSNGIKVDMRDIDLSNCERIYINVLTGVFTEEYRKLFCNSKQKYLVLMHKGNDIFPVVKDTLEQANAEAESHWNHLTEGEKKKQHIEVVLVKKEYLNEDAFMEDCVDWCGFHSYDVEEGFFDSDKL